MIPESTSAPEAQSRAALVEALRKYARHGVIGGAMCERSKHSDYPCTCGLDEILAAEDDGSDEADELAAGGMSPLGRELFQFAADLTRMQAGI